MARQARRGRAWRDEAGQERLGTARTGMARRGRSGKARRGAAGHGSAGVAWPGVERTGKERLGSAGEAGIGEDRTGQAGPAWRGKAWFGRAWFGRAWFGMVRQEWTGMHRHGIEWRGEAGMTGKGGERHGRARHGRHGAAGHGAARRGLAGTEPNINTHEERPMDRERVKAELDQISKAHDGLLKPEDVVEFASDPETALHGEFTWDDTEAAREHRLEQARRVIRVVVEIIPQSTEPIRAFVSLVPDRRNRGGGYRPTSDVLENADWREQLLAQALRELQSWRAKYEQLKALAPVFEAMNQIEAKPTKKGRNPARVAQAAV